jgi:hypothetical protein
MGLASEYTLHLGLTPWNFTDGNPWKFWWEPLGWLGGQERKADMPPRVVGIEVHEDERLPCTEGGPPTYDRNGDGRADERRQQMVGAVSR